MLYLKTLWAHLYFLLSMIRKGLSDSVEGRRIGMDIVLLRKAIVGEALSSRSRQQPLHRQHRRDAGHEPKGSR